jgi:hypothetical protein
LELEWRNPAFFFKCVLRYNPPGRITQ